MSEPTTKGFTFDVKLFTTLTVTATSEAEARKLLNDCLSGAYANFGCLPDGEPLCAEVHPDDGEQPLVEIDGEAV